MLKKTTMLLVFNLIAIHNSFAMEKERAPMRPSKKINHIFIGFGQFNKYEQDLNNKLQSLNSDKKNLINDNDQMNEHIKKNTDIIAKNYNTQKGLLVVTVVLAATTGGAGVIPLLGMLCVNEDSEYSKEHIGHAELKLKANNNVLHKIDQDVNKIISSLSKLNEKERLVRQLLLQNPQRSSFNNSYRRPIDYDIHESVTIVRDPIEPIDRWYYEQELHRIFSGSDSEGIMYPHHPEHDNFVSAFFISSSDVSDDEFEKNRNQNAIICVRAWETSDDEPKLEVPSDTAWDSDALEYDHNWALLTNDAYCPYNNIYDFMNGENNI